jgi:hypothetical protein
MEGRPDLEELRTRNRDDKQRWRKTQLKAEHAFKGRLKKTEQEWLQSRNKVTRFEFTCAQKHALQQWFNSMDVSGNGNVSMHDLTDALLSTGGWTSPGVIKYAY